MDTKRETEATPGPWRLRALVAESGRRVECLSEVEDKNGNRIAGCWGDDPSQPTHAAKMANARLIAAAPAMRDALTALLSAYYQDAYQGTCHFCDGGPDAAEVQPDTDEDPAAHANGCPVMLAHAALAQARGEVRHG